MDSKDVEVKAAGTPVTEAGKKRKQRFPPTLDESNIIKTPNESETRRTTRAIARGDTPVVQVKKAKVVVRKSAAQNGEKKSVGRSKKNATQDSVKETQSDSAEKDNTKMNNSENKEEDKNSKNNNNNNESEKKDKKAEEVNGEKDEKAAANSEVKQS